MLHVRHTGSKKKRKRKRKGGALKAWCTVPGDCSDLQLFLCTNLLNLRIFYSFLALSLFFFFCYRVSKGSTQKIRMRRRRRQPKSQLSAALLIFLGSSQVLSQQRVSERKDLLAKFSTGACHPVRERASSSPRAEHKCSEDFQRLAQKKKKKAHSWVLNPPLCGNKMKLGFVFIGVKILREDDLTEIPVKIWENKQQGVISD